MEEMGMTDNQWKDFLRGYKDDLEELKEYREDGNNEAFDRKMARMLKRIQESLESQGFAKEGGLATAPLQKNYNR